jgi:hypothetical protein
MKSLLATLVFEVLLLFQEFSTRYAILSILFVAGAVVIAFISYCLGLLYKVVTIPKTHDVEPDQSGETEGWKELQREMYQ